MVKARLGSRQLGGSAGILNLAVKLWRFVFSYSPLLPSSPSSSCIVALKYYCLSYHADWLIRMYYVEMKRL